MSEEYDDGRADESSRASGEPLPSAQDTLDMVRDQLRNWPYTIHQIDDTLDISLIEGRGKQLLFRAIHARNLTAFAGTGLSIAYGRLGWKEWEAEQQRIASFNSDRFLELTEAAIALIDHLIIFVTPPSVWKHLDRAAFDGTGNNYAFWKRIHETKEFEEVLPQKHAHNVWRWLRTRLSALHYAKRQVQSLKQTFDLTQHSDGSFPGGEELPVKFEVAQQLHQELHRHVPLFLPPGRTKADPDSEPEEWLNKAYLGAREDNASAAPTKAIEALRNLLSKNNMLPDPALDRKKGLHQTYEEAFREFAIAMCAPEAALKFETLAKALLVDECPHAELLLRDGVFRGKDPKDASEDEKLALKKLRRGLDVFNLDNLKRDPDGIRERGERYRVLTPFKIKNVKMLVKELEGNSSAWSRLDAVVLQALTGFITDGRHVDPAGPRVFLSPSSRFLVSVYLCRHGDPMKYLEHEETSSEENGFRVLRKPIVEDFANRKSIIAEKLDPLRRVVSELGIRRFVTTNYDFEIERFFQDSGYRGFPARPAGPVGTRLPDHKPDAFRTDSIGGVLRDQTFTQETAADMIGFAIEDGAQDAAVYHLHGRATRDDGLVITERDYMELYMTDGPGRATADEGISLIFSGAPLIFLGLGMSETDLLRPLRQFISNRDRTIGYTSIALLPADRSIRARTKFSSALFLRYGIYTIFYGSGALSLRRLKDVGRADVDATAKTDRGLDWMNRVLSLISAMKDLTESFLKAKTGKSDLSDQIASAIEKDCVSRAVAIFAHLEKALGPIESDLADGEDYPASTPAIDVLLGIDYPPEPDGTDKKDPAERREEHRYRLCDQLLTETKQEQPRKLGIAHCAFTTIRPRNRESRYSNLEPHVHSSHYLKFEAELLTEMLVITLGLDASVKENDLRARILMLDGLNGAVRTGCMNAALASIVQEQRQWWKRFQQSPPHRLARLQELGKHKSPLPRRYVRHRVDSTISDLRRLEEPAPNLPLRDPARPEELGPRMKTDIRAFDTLIAAIDAGFETHRFDPRKRALLTVAAHRGLGKGTFMGALSSLKGLDLYHRAAWGNHRSVSLTGAIFLNLSFSPEIGSVYDMLIEAIRKEAILVECGADLEPALVTDALKRIAQRERYVSRMTRLTAALVAYGDASRTAARSSRNGTSRLLIAISAVELLFDAQCRIKNAEIERFLEILTGSETETLPVDIVFVGAERGLGPPWSLSPKGARAAATPHRLLLNRVGIPQRAEESVERRRARSKIVLDKLPPRKAADTPLHFIHFARPVNPTAFLVDNFPMLATALFLANHPLPRKGSEKAHANDLEIARKSFKATVAISLKASDNFLQQLWMREDLPRREELACARDFVRRSVVFGTQGESDYGAELPDKIAEAAERIRSDTFPSEPGSLSADRDTLIEKVTAVAEASQVEEEERPPRRADGSRARFLGALRQRLRNDPHRREWREVRQRLGDSRFAMTILIAAAEHMVIHAREPVAAGKRASDFILSTVERSRNFGTRRRDEHVLETVLESYRKYHRIGDADLDCDFHLLLLRHLGVIATPVGSAVLVRLPEIREYFARIKIELETSRRRFLVRALTTLAYRGLVFRLEPHPRLIALEDAAPASWPASEEYRYALHRIVQRLAISKLNAGAEDSVRSNTFAPTLYAAMPSTGPRLSPESYDFVRTLLSALSQYPDVPNREAGITPWLFTTRERSVRVQALRAALSLLRSNLSVAIVSRLGETLTNPPGLQKRGYLETYKVRLRWIVRLSWELLDDKYRQNDLSPDQEFDQINALYRDEIVWIYNELGVVSLAQGALSDSLGFLRQAADFNQHIEGRQPGGPNHDHITLNHAIVQLERGRIASARQRLVRVAEASARRECVLHFVSRGYLCVLDHITGRHEGLDDKFEKVTRALQKLPATRASAIMLQHRARFLLKSDALVARDSIDRATVLAETGGHEDVRHHCNLVSLRLDFGADAERHLVPTDRALSILHGIEQFGTRMAIWSLQCECLMFRASLLLSEGETTTAGRLLVRALALAKRHSMGLRLNRATTLYSLMLLHRGDTLGARRTANLSLEMAKSHGYNLETSRAQQILSSCAGDMPTTLTPGAHNQVQF